MNPKVDTIFRGKVVKLTRVWREGMGVTKNYLKNYNIYLGVPFKYLRTEILPPLTFHALTFLPLPYLHRSPPINYVFPLSKPKSPSYSWMHLISCRLWTAQKCPCLHHYWWPTCSFQGYTLLKYILTDIDMLVHPSHDVLCHNLHQSKVSCSCLLQLHGQSNKIHHRNKSLRVPAYPYAAIL